MKSFAFFSLLMVSTAFAEIKVSMNYTPTANLVYQLDCLSESIPHCSRETYRDLWQKQFFMTDEDQAMVKSWGELMKRYHPELELSDLKEQEITGRFEGVQLARKIRIASFQSTSMADYFNRLDLVILPKDREKFEKVVRHFYPRFEKWWKTTALPVGAKFTQQTDALLKRPDISKKLKQYAHFYQANLPDAYVVHFNLFYRPEFKEATSGEQIENYSVAEFLATEKPVDRIDVIIHELCHFFYESGEGEKFVDLVKSFQAVGKPESKGAYNLLNETLATTMGNGLINKVTMDKSKWESYLTKPQSFYNSYAIDKAAKTTLPWLETWMNEGKTLYDPQFVETYVSNLEKTFGKELTAPKLILNEMVFIADGKFERKYRDTARKAFRASSMYSGQGDWEDPRTLNSYNNKPGLSVLMIVHASNIAKLKNAKILNDADFETVKKQLKEKNQAVYSFQRNPKSSVYLVIASNEEEASGLIEKLSEVKEGFVGVLN